MKKTPEDWFMEIDTALDYREKFARERNWKKLELSYLNDPTSDAALGPNLIFSMGDSLISQLMIPDPEYIITPEHPAGLDKAPIVEALDNWLVKKLKIKKSVNIAVLHMYLYSRGILKIGYDSEFGWSPFYDIGVNDNLLGMTFTQFNKKGERIESMNSSPGMPWILPVLPHDFVVPWGTINLEDAPWAAHRILRSNEFIKADPKYKNTSRLEPQISMQDWIGSYSNVAGKSRTKYSNTNAFEHAKLIKYNELWEIRDRMTGRVLVVSREHDKFLRDDIDALQVAGMPFVSGTLIDHPRSFWSTPQAYYIGQAQRTQFDISLQAEKQRRINCLKFIADKNALTSQELSKITSGDVGAVALAETSKPLKDVIVTVPQGNPMNYAVDSANNRQDAREAMGLTRMDLGNFDSPSARRTVGEVSGVRDSSLRRSGRRANVVVDLYIDAISKLNRIIFELWKTPRYILMGKDFIPFTGEELKGDYLYEASLVNKRTVGKAQRKTEALMLTIQLMQIPGVNIPELFELLQDASADPAFEGILSQIIGKSGSVGQSTVVGKQQESANQPRAQATNQGGT